MPVLNKSWVVTTRIDPPTALALKKAADKANMRRSAWVSALIQRELKRLGELKVN